MRLGPLDGFIGGATLRGDGPAWLSSGLDVLHRNADGYQPLPNTKMLWLVRPDTTPVVAIQGREMKSGTPM